MGSVDKALIVLNYLAEAGPEGASLAQIADRAAVSKSTIHRTLAALRFRDYVWQHPENGTYRLGRAAITLGDNFSTGAGLTNLLSPVLEIVKDRFDELCQLGALDGQDVVYLAKVEPTHPVRVWSEVGRRLPARITALGRALLAAHIAAQTNDPAYLNSPDLAQSEPIQYALDQGFAKEVGDSEPGIACVAVPIMRSDHPVAAISLTMPQARFSDPIDLGLRLRELVEKVLPEPFTVGLTLPPAA